jgi:hypothetical protein
MQGRQTQAKSTYPRRITGTRLRSHIRVRGADNDRTVLPGIDLLSASRRVRLAPILLEEGALFGLIPHYKLGGLIRFDPAELDAWVTENGIDDLWPDRGEEA